ncbi:MAG: aconitate hydratase B, partial [Snodgrassella sp.]|nr:aconitate hydratase B [Snodgrassella sp.]
MLEAYRTAAIEREALGIPPLPLTAKQTEELVELLKNPPKGEETFLVDLLSHRVPPGVDDASKVKASFLGAIAEKTVSSPLITPTFAVELLGTMLGGYNVQPLIEFLDNEELAATAANALKHTLLMFDAFHDVEERMSAA